MKSGARTCVHAEVGKVAGRVEEGKYSENVRGCVTMRQN